MKFRIFELRRVMWRYDRSWHCFLFQRFAIEERLVDGIRLNVPTNPEKLASETNQSRFTGCNLTNIQRYYSKYGRDISSDAILFKRKALEVLSAAMNALDRLVVRFWLSSGTCLGKQIQCLDYEWIYAFILRSFDRSFVCSVIHSLALSTSFARSHVFSLACAFVRWLVPSPVLSSICPFLVPSISFCYFLPLFFSIVRISLVRSVNFSLFRSIFCVVVVLFSLSFARFFTFPRLGSRLFTQISQSSYVQISFRFFQSSAFFVDFRS